MGKPPRRCPMCHNVRQWKRVDKQNKGLSAGKAVVGGALTSFLINPLAAPVGAIAGASLGKKHVTYCCGNCGFQHEY